MTMNTFLTRMTTAILLSLSPLGMALAAECAKPPLTPAADIAASIDRGAPATPTVVFERGTAKLAPASRDQLAQIVALLDDQLDLHIQVGFAAGDQVTPELAQARARALRNALLDLDAPANRVAVRQVKAEAEIAKVEIAGGAQQCAAPVAGS
jgi:outer membrane protein OmpA-like peptidoglycan-associated protein